jgi:SAM-dependent methyltransferase
MSALGQLYSRVAPWLNLANLAHLVAGVPRFVRDYATYGRLEPLRLRDIYPMLLDWYESAGVASGHYFHQDLWAARKVFASGIQPHVDVGSRVDGFVAHCAVFTRVMYLDVRPLPPVANVISIAGSVTALPFADGSLQSVSCLHVLEHIGLGRYGDPIDPTGTRRGCAELARVLAPQGHLYIGIPIGRERVCFNAHRVHAPATILEYFRPLRLQDSAVVDDCGLLHDPADPRVFAMADYACALLHFTKS